jgi:serine O-acetyltransferase
MPTLGDSVFVGAGAKIIGAVSIGDRVFVGVNVVVTKNVPDDAVVLLRAEPEIRVGSARGAAHGSDVDVGDFGGTRQA